jgi:hypothetical protein
MFYANEHKKCPQQLKWRAYPPSSMEDIANVVIIFETGKRKMNNYS